MRVDTAFWARLVLAVLATWRLTHLLAREDGPADLLVRLRDFSQNHGSPERQSLQPAVVDLLARLSPLEIQAVADYTSRLPALQAH